MTGKSIRHAFIFCIFKYIKRTVRESVYDIPKIIKTYGQCRKIAITDPEKIQKSFRSQHL